MTGGRKIVLLGGGAGGLLTAALLARGGNEVTVLERDPAPPPATRDEAWDRWERRGVPQFRQPHALTVRCMEVLDTEFPEAAATIRSIGPSFNLARRAPQTELLADGERDRSAWFVRRPTLEMLLAVAVDRDAGVEVRRGCAVTGLVTDSSGDDRVRVVGVTTDAGDTVTGDLVVDCSGRRTTVGGWLADLGSPVEQSSELDGFTYAARWFRLSGEPPELGAGNMGGIGPGLLALIFPADGDVVGIALVGSARDPLFRRVQKPGPFMSVARSFPLVAEWLDPASSEPITEVMPMASLQNRMLRLRRDDAPGPIGIVNTSDAFVSTNPSLGRGLGITADMAVRLGDLLDDESDPVQLVDRWDGLQTRFHRPWLADSIASDANMRDAFAALIDDRPPEPPAAWRADLAKAATVDLDCWRAFTSVNHVLAPPTRWLEDEELLRRATDIAADLPAMQSAMTRSELEDLTA